MRRGLVLIEPSRRFSRIAEERRQGAGSKLEVCLFFFFPLQAHGDVCRARGRKKKLAVHLRELLRNLIRLRRNVGFLRSEASGQVSSRGTNVNGTVYVIVARPVPRVNCTLAYYVDDKRGR